MSRKDCGHTTVLNKIKDKIRNELSPDLTKQFCSQCTKWLSPNVIQELYSREIAEEEKKWQERELSRCLNEN